MLIRLVSLVVCGLGIVLSGCATNPVTGKSNFVMLSEEQELKIGREADDDVKKRFGVYDDKELNDYVQRVGQRLAEQSHRPGLIYRFTVLDTPDVNAFALPGGYIYITRGLMAYLNSEAELAGVLGHEIGHVTARHGVRQYSAAQAAGIGYTIGTILVPELAGQGARSLFSVLSTSLLSGYGRKHELESDRLGAQYLARSGYDPQAMLEVIGVLKNQEVAAKEIAEKEGREANTYHGVFSTHPDNDQRLQEVIAEAGKVEASDSPYQGRQEYIDQIDGLVFGDSPSQGVRRGRYFYHQELDFKLAFPEGWRTNNLPDRVDSSPRENDAILQVTMTDRNRQVSPLVFISKRLKQSKLQQAREMTINGFKVGTGVGKMTTPFGYKATRIIVLYDGDRAFMFFGATKGTDLSKYDDDFLATARSFDRLSEEDRGYAKGLRISVVKASSSDNIEALAKRSPLNKYPEVQLRLLNDLYPSGEPKPAQLLKMIE
ncbi:MAG: M48 family metalloprotease [Gammaproteobacteria bacterium]|nr:M48 family metalloprotease [Gammaproteobacteria bacterium]